MRWQSSLTSNLNKAIKLRSFEIVEVLIGAHGRKATQVTQAYPGAKPPRLPRGMAKVHRCRAFSAKSRERSGFCALTKPAATHTEC